ncbi:hypothetical protein BDV35DRAFT_368859 [Aspergillus flavus]|uniref:Uncharacterized protein n=1 Tax=Aspergillus flavus TaxID=5059 RepID=A0A5N6GKV3_ASPFL|nr:hypothetical protein BDV35DRAFT_368859 [Aspergillus flavus]
MAEACQPAQWIFLRLTKGDRLQVLPVVKIVPIGIYLCFLILDSRYCKRLISESSQTCNAIFDRCCTKGSGSIYIIPGILCMINPA